MHTILPDVATSGVVARSLDFYRELAEKYGPDIAFECVVYSRMLRYDDATLGAVVRALMGARGHITQPVTPEALVSTSTTSTTGGAR